MFRIQEDDPKLTFCNGTVLHKNQVRFSFGDWFQGILELSRNLHQMEIDMSAFSCLAASSKKAALSVACRSRQFRGPYSARSCSARCFLASRRRTRMKAGPAPKTLPSPPMPCASTLVFPAAAAVRSGDTQAARQLLQRRPGGELAVPARAWRGCQLAVVDCVLQGGQAPSPSLAGRHRDGT